MRKTNAKGAFFLFDATRGLPILIGIIAFLWFALNVAPTVTYGSDCGEFAATAFNLGVGHPTGFAFYCLVARTWISVLAWGEVAWRMNILSALCGALCIALVCAICVRALNNRVLDGENNDASNDDKAVAWASAGACLLLAGFLWFFGQAVIINVHIMIATMTALMIFCAVKWHQSVQENAADWRWIYSLAILMGLGLNTHMSWIFAFPGLFYLAVWNHRAVFGSKRAYRKRIGGMLAFTFAAYALTLYLPLRASLFPTPVDGHWWPLDWTHTANFSSWYAHVRAHQYEFLFLQPTQIELFGHTFVTKWFASSPLNIPGKLWDLLILLFAQLLWALPLVFWGAREAFKRDRALAIALLLIVVCNLGFEMNYNVPLAEMANFIFPAYLVMAIWMAFGLHSFLRAMQSVGARWDARSQSSTRSSSTRTRKSAPMWSWRLGTLAKLLVPATILAQWSNVLPRTLRGDVRAREAGIERAVALEKLQKQFPNQTVTAVMTGSDDTLWSFWYAQFVLRRARGAKTPWGVPLRRDWKRVGMAELTRNWQTRGPVAFTYFYPQVDDKFPLTPLSPNGLIWLASRRALPLAATPISQIEYSNAQESSAQNASAKVSKTTNASAQNVSVNDSLAPTFSQNASAKIASAKLASAILNVSFPPAMMRRDVETQSETAHLKRENMTTLTVDFRAPFVAPLSRSETGAPTVDNAQKPAAQHVGFVEIMLSPRGFFKSAPPASQAEVIEKDWRAPSSLATDTRRAPLQVTQQTVRLVVAQNAKIGDVLRAQLPLQIGVSGLGNHEVWLRLMRHKTDKTTAWKRVATVRVTGA